MSEQTEALYRLETEKRLAATQAELWEVGQQLGLARLLLFYGHHCSGKYGDDGEMQCSQCGIDFKRMSIGEIQERITRRALSLAAETLAHAPPPTAAHPNHPEIPESSTEREE